MATELQLIKKIQALKQIKPRKEWVFLAKTQILGENEGEKTRFSSILSIFRPFILQRYQLVLATFLFFGILVSGAFSFAQTSLPGDLLYPLKRVAESGRAILASDEEKPQVQLELANKRLEELTKIAEANQTKKLASAINEFQASVSQAAKDLKNPPKITKEIVAQTKKLEENKKKVESLGVVVGDVEELDNTLKTLVGREIKDLENKTLTEEQGKTLEEAKEFFEAGNYSQSLEKILNLSYPQDK